MGVGAQPPPVGGVDSKCVAVMFELSVAAHDEVMGPVPLFIPFVLHMKLSNSVTEPPVHGAGEPQAHALHDRESVALVPVVLRFEKPVGQTFWPSLAMQDESPNVVRSAHA